MDRSEFDWAHVRVRFFSYYTYSTGFRHVQPLSVRKVRQMWAKCFLCCITVFMLVFPGVIKLMDVLVMNLHFCPSVFISLSISVFQVKKKKTEAVPRSFPQPAPSGDPISRPLTHLPDRSPGARAPFPPHSPDRSISSSADGMNLSPRTASPARSTETFNRSVCFAWTFTVFYLSIF